MLLWDRKNLDSTVRTVGGASVRHCAARKNKKVPGAESQTIWYWVTRLRLLRPGGAGLALRPLRTVKAWHAALYPPASVALPAVCSASVAARTAQVFD